MVCDEDDHIREAMQAGSDVFVIFDSPPPEAEQSELRSSGMPPLADGHLDLQNQGGFSEALRGLLFLLTGYRNDGPPFRGFQPTALPELLSQSGVIAVILVHQDKHAPCIGIYSNGDGQGLLERLQAIGPEKGMVVPFAIPPMLARWDRALGSCGKFGIQTRWASFQSPNPMTAAAGVDGINRMPQKGKITKTKPVNARLNPIQILKPIPHPWSTSNRMSMMAMRRDFQDDEAENLDGNDDDGEDDGEDDAFADDDFGDLDDAFGDIEVSTDDEDEDSPEEVVTEKDSAASDSGKYRSRLIRDHRRLLPHPKHDNQAHFGSKNSNTGAVLLLWLARPEQSAPEHRAW